MRLRHEKGQGLVEYALILVLVTIIVIAVLMLKVPNLTPIINLLVAWNRETIIVFIIVIGMAFLGLRASLSFLKNSWKATEKKEYPPEERQ